MKKYYLIFISTFFTVALLNAQSFSSDKIKVENKIEGQHSIGGNWGIRSPKIMDSTLPRILLIGDSMLGQYGDEVVNALSGLANVDRWTTGAFVSDKMTDEMAQVVSSQRYQIIHFNESGLHSLSMDRVPFGEYGIRMEKYLKTLKQAAPNAKLIWARTTPVTVKGNPGALDDTLTNIVVEHNLATEPYIIRNNIRTNDLYTLMLAHLDLAKGDKWHWNNEGALLMANAVVEIKKNELGNK